MCSRVFSRQLTALTIVRISNHNLQLMLLVMKTIIRQLKDVIKQWICCLAKIECTYTSVRESK